MSHVSLSRIHHTRRERKSYGIGPMRIYFADNDENVPCEIILAVLNTFAQICIGATNALVVFFAIIKSDPHAFLCGIGYNFFMIEGVLSLNNTNGWTMGISLRKRRFVHMFLQFCAIACIITGTLLPIFAKLPLKNPHAILALMAMICSLITFLIGPFALFGSQRWKIFHVTFGIPSIILAYLCLLHGLIGYRFPDWAGKYVPYVVIAVALYFVVYLVVMVFLKCVLRMKYSPNELH